MKPNNHNRQNRRFTNNRNNRPAQNITRNTSLDSSGPAGKLHGTALQLHEKYIALAKDAATQNDMILAEQYRQYADHYMHLQNIAIENENAMRAAREAQSAANQSGQTEAEAEQESAESHSENNEATESEMAPTEDLSVPVAEMNAAANPERE